MACIQYEDILPYLSSDNQLGEGNESKVYSYQGKVIKLFKEERKTSIPRINDEGLLRLSVLKLHCFNNPIDTIYRDNVIVGYTEKFLERGNPNFSLIDFDAIKEDILVLSENGFTIEDLFYNYMFTKTGFSFFDLTCYHYIKTDVVFLKQQIRKKNIEIVNNFFIGLLLFDAFKEGAKGEYTKIFLANQYRLEHCQDLFYGDFLKGEKNKRK